MPNATATRHDTFRVSVKIAGNSAGVWDKMTGGKVDSDDLKYKPGGMGPALSLGGSVMTDNVIVSKLFRTGDGANQKLWLSYVGRATAEVSKQTLNFLGVAIGDPLVYIGTLKSVHPAEVDSEGNGAGMIEIEVSVDGLPS